MAPLARRTQLAWALGLGALFFLVYGPVNAWSATLGPLPSLALPWEQRIPFVPWAVVPYTSLDLFFLLSFLQLRDRTELHRHALRLGVTILVSAALFLAFPLRFGLTRPETTGLPGLLFSALALDLPYNQCPSLHIALALVIWPVVRRLAAGRRRGLLAAWFLLIAASTLLTWQHHLVDLLGGAIVGLLVLQAIPLHDGPRTPVGNAAYRIGDRYAAVALACLWLAFQFGGWGLLLLYPFVSCALVAVAYLSGRADYLSKRDGRHCAVVRLLFGPFLLAQRLTWRVCRDKGAPWSEVAPGLYAGRRPAAHEVAALRGLGVRSVIDLAPEIGEARGWGDVRYHHRPWLDLVPPSAAQRAEVTALIDAALVHGPVYLHCTLGRGRGMLAALDWRVAQGVPEARARAELSRLRPLALPQERSTNNNDNCIEEPRHGQRV